MLFRGLSDLLVWGCRFRVVGRYLGFECVVCRVYSAVSGSGAVESIGLE